MRTVTQLTWLYCGQPREADAISQNLFKLIFVYAVAGGRGANTSYAISFNTDRVSQWENLPIS